MGTVLSGSRSHATLDWALGTHGSYTEQKRPTERGLDRSNLERDAESRGLANCTIEREMTVPPYRDR